MAHAVTRLPPGDAMMVDPMLAMIERAARDPAVDLDRLERLVALKDRTDAQRAKQLYLAAFAQLQSELPAAARGGVGHNRKTYARFEDLITALRPVMAKHGFSLSHRVNTDGGAIRVTGVLGHEGGHSEQTEMVLPPDASGGKTPVHAMGSSISYGKRYVTLTLTGIATTDDDDGKVASATDGSHEPITDEQAAELAKLITDTKTDIGKFLEMGKVESLTEITQAQFPNAKAMLVAKAHKMRGA